MSTIRLKDGNFISVECFEIEAVPNCLVVSDNPLDAELRITNLFSEILTTISYGAGLQDTCIEILCESEAVSSQVYDARIRFFLILRKHGRSKVSIENSLSSSLSIIKSSLESSSYILSEVSESDVFRQFQTQNHIAKKTVSLEKKIKMGVVEALGGYLCYTDFINNVNSISFSRVFEVMTHFPGVSLSFFLIPTEFTQTEKVFMDSISYSINSPAINKNGPIEDMTCIRFYRDISKELGKRFFLYAMIIHGDGNAVDSVSARLANALCNSGQETEICVWDRTKTLSVCYNSYRTFPWNCLTKLIDDGMSEISVPPVLKRLTHLCSLTEAVSFFRLPYDADNLVGINVNRVGKTRETLLSIPDEMESLTVGIVGGNSYSGKTIPIRIPLNTFTRHTLIAGMPGTGKTTFSINVLLQFYRYGIPFLVIEPTKAEYRAMIDAIPELQVFTPGKNSVIPFILNPFIPPRGITLEVFKPSLLAAFKAAFSMPNPLDILFANAMDLCYTKNGWKSYSKSGDEDVRIFSLYDFILVFKELIRKSSYSSEIKGNMESAGTFRLMNLIVQNGNIYDTEKTVPLHDLLSKPTVIELNSLENHEQKALIMALLLINIVLFTKQNNVGDGNLKNILMIDEAHVLLGSESSSQDGAADAGKTTVQALQNMIAEIRSYGTGIIIADQSPRKVTREIVGNTDIKVVFQLVETSDREIISSSMNMSDNEASQLPSLKTGEAFVYFRSLEHPIRMKTSDARLENKIRLSVSDDELIRKTNYWCEKKDLLKPYIDCDLCGICRECVLHIRDDAKYYVDSFFNKDKSHLTDKLSLCKAVFNLGNRIENLPKYGDNAGQLVFCTVIRYLRKVKMEVGLCLSQKEKNKIIPDIMKSIPNGGENNGD